jgi:phage shock protein C
MTGTGRKPLRRSKDNRVIAGVCAGVAAWMGWEPLAGRFLFVLLSVMSVIIPGIIVYAVLWILIPEKERPDSA